MARIATVVGMIADAWGHTWDVREYRPAPFGQIALGWPIAHPRGRGGTGGPQVIITTDLQSYMEAHRYRGAVSDMESELPIGGAAIKRLRRILGHDAVGDRDQWWIDRTDDLLTLTVEEFCFKHSVSAGAVVNAQKRMGIGRKNREPGWWHTPEVKALLNSNLPRSFVADKLGVSVGSVGRLRWLVSTPGAETRMRQKNRQRKRRDTAAKFAQQLRGLRGLINE